MQDRMRQIGEKNGLSIAVVNGICLGIYRRFHEDWLVNHDRIIERQRSLLLKKGVVFGS
jgi:hypothetical protein